MESLPTGFSQIDGSLTTFDGMVLGGLPKGHLIELRLMPEAPAVQLCIALVSYMLHEEIVKEVSWFDAMLGPSNSELAWAFYSQGITRNVTYVQLTHLKAKAQKVNELLLSMGKLTDLILIFGFDQLYEEKVGELMPCVHTAVDVATKYGTTIIACTASWFSPIRGGEYSITERLLEQYAALGLRLEDNGDFTFLYSGILTSQVVSMPHISD